MKTLEYVKNNIGEFERDDFLDKRFTRRFLDFIEESEWEKFGFKRKEDYQKKARTQRMDGRKCIASVKG